MNKRIYTQNQPQLINEMKSLLNTMPTRKRGLLEGIIYGEDGEEMEDNGEVQGMPQGMPQGNNSMQQEDDEQMSQQYGGQMPQGKSQQMGMGEDGKPNPLDEDPEIAKLITGIRVQTLQGLTKLAENPESAQYELLKKIFLLVDKAVEDKVDPEK